MLHQYQSSLYILATIITEESNIGKENSKIMETGNLCNKPGVRLANARQNLNNMYAGTIGIWRLR